MNPLFRATTEQLKMLRDRMEEGQRTLAELEKAFTRHVLEHREALVASWVAETGLKPSESVICHGYRDGHMRLWIESKDENDKRAVALEYDMHKYSEGFE